MARQLSSHQTRSPLRYTGAGLGYQLSSIIAGGPAVLIATWLIHQFGTGYAVSVYILISAVITLVALKCLKYRSRSDITDETTRATGFSR